MEGSFTSLLNDGFEFEDLVFSQPAPQSQPQQEATKSKKGKRSKNFLIEEDMLLISAWLNISSMDPIQGNNQSHSRYWDRIWKYFNENKGTIVSDRTTNSLCNRWCTINEKVAKFVGFCNQIFAKNQSGLTEQNKIDGALEMYESVMKEKFMFMRHWSALRFAPKFQSSLDFFRGNCHQIICAALDSYSTILCYQFSSKSIAIATLAVGSQSRLQRCRDSVAYKECIYRDFVASIP